MLVLHHLENSRSQRIAWAMELLDLAYEVKVYQRTADKVAPEALKAAHPLGHAPVLQHGDRMLAESGAILEYLLEAFDTEHRFAPQTQNERIQYRYWLHFAEGSLMPWLVMGLLFNKLPRQPMPFFVKPIAKGISSKVMTHFIHPRMSDALKFIDSHLAAHAWFAGDTFTMADVQMSFPLLALELQSSLGAYPNIQRWLALIKKDPSFQKANQRVGGLQPF